MRFPIFGVWRLQVSGILFFGTIMQGWIKLHRKLLEWEWFSEPKTLSVFIYLLLSARRNDGSWRGIEIKTGELITSFGKIAEDTGLSIQEVRTAIYKLTGTHEITSRATNKYTIITISNYESYQDIEDSEQQANQQAEQQAEQQTTNKQSNKQSTTNKNIKNNKNDKKEENDIPPQTDLFGETPKKKQKGKKEGACLFENSKYHDFTIFEKEFDKPEFAGIDIYYYYQAISDWSASGGKKKHDWIATARNWMRSDMSKNQLHRIKSNEVDPDMIEYLHSMQQ